MSQRLGDQGRLSEVSPPSRGRLRALASVRSEAHELALADAYLLLELAQSDPPPTVDEAADDRPATDPWPAGNGGHRPGTADSQLAALRRRAHDQGWTDVAFIVQYARWSRAIVSEQDPSTLQESIEALARESGDDSLEAVVLASRAQLGWSGHGRYAPGADADVARAVALLEQGNGDLVHQPAAWVACALAYAYCGMRDLEREMHERAIADLSLPWQGVLDRIRVTTWHAVAGNRIESRTERAASLYEDGTREAAAAAAREGLLGLREDVAGLPALWVNEYLCLLHLLEAIAGEPASSSLEQVIDQVHGSPWPGFAACARLAVAVRAADAGRAVEAAGVATDAAVAMCPDLLPGTRMLALSIGARQSGLSPAGQLYVDELLRVHAAGQRRAVEAARSRQVAEHVQQENKVLSERAYVDELTGLANRHVYTRQLERLRLLRTPELIAVLLLDVDHFKAVNDTFGHSVGDEVLRRCAVECAVRFRPTDLVARLGGDEFIMVRATPDPDEMRWRAESLVRSVGAHPWNQVHPDLRVTMSAGMAIGRPADVDDLLERADAALYRAKARGRNRLVSELHDDALSSPPGGVAAGRGATW